MIRIAKLPAAKHYILLKSNDIRHPRLQKRIVIPNGNCRPHLLKQGLTRGKIKVQSKAEILKSEYQNLPEAKWG